MFDQEVLKAVDGMAQKLGVEAAALLAVAEVESGGRVVAMVDGRPEPLIRFEGHYFDRRLTGAKRDRARAAGLAAPVAGAIANPATQSGRWRLLRDAARIDHVAAHESTSWGLGQVMGAHWQWLGFDSVDALVAEARSGATGQIRLMCRYIEKADLRDVILRRDWVAFARAYNGPAYARNAYHTRIAAAYQRHRKTEGTVPDKTPALDIRDLQRMLSAAGYPLKVDGAMGPLTIKAIRRFQAAHGLTVDGIAGPKTIAVLRATMPLGNGGTDLWGRILRVLRRIVGGR